MTEGPVEPYAVDLEGVVYTLVDVHPGHDEDFERWYESDHFYAGGTLGPSVLSGRRWYASRELRTSRFVAPGCLLPDPYAGTNLATYWLTTGGLTAFYDWVRPQLQELRDGGRMFASRTHVNTDGYRRESVLDAPGLSPVRPHVALDHPFPGLFVLYGQPDGGPGDASAAVPEGSLVITFRPNAGSVRAGSLGVTEMTDVVNPVPGMTFPTDGEPVRLVLAFLPEPPIADPAWTRDLSAGLAARTGSRALWGGAFLPVVPGSLAHIPRLR